MKLTKPGTIGASQLNSSVGQTFEGGTIRRVRYSVAMSLDGYLAGPKGEIDWITTDPEVDFVGLAAQFDTMVMGRKTYEFAREHGASVRMPGISPYVFSNTLEQTQCPDATVSADARGTVSSLKREEGKDTWLFGGGSLFRSLLDLGLVDTIEVAIVPLFSGVACHSFLSGGRGRRCASSDTVYMRVPAGCVGVRGGVRRCRTRRCS